MLTTKIFFNLSPAEWTIHAIKLVHLFSIPNGSWLVQAAEAVAI